MNKRVLMTHNVQSDEHLWSYQRTSVQLRLLEIRPSSTRGWCNNLIQWERKINLFLISKYLGQYNKITFLCILINLFIWLYQVLVEACGIYLSDQDPTWATCIESAEFLPLDYQGSPKITFSRLCITLTILNDTDQVTKMSKPVKNLNLNFSHLFLGWSEMSY